MAVESSVAQYSALLISAIGLAPIFLLLFCFIRIMRWTKKSKGAFVFLAVFPLISLFPIPPQATENLDKQRTEQIKRKQNAGDPPDLDEDKI